MDYDAAVNDRTGQVCLTEDGVLLRANIFDPDRRREVQAVRVTYAEQPEAYFDRPQGSREWTRAKCHPDWARDPWSADPATATVAARPVDEGHGSRGNQESCDSGSRVGGAHRRDPAPAQDRPKLHPTRDVEVEYRTTGMPRAPTAPANPDPNAGAGGALTMHFTTKGNRLRIEGMNGRGYAIIDKDAGRMIMVMTERKMNIEMPRDMTGEPNVLEGWSRRTRHSKKLARKSVAGLNCTTYETSHQRP